MTCWQKRKQGEKMVECAETDELADRPWNEERQSPRGLQEADSCLVLLCSPCHPLPHPSIFVRRNANSHYLPCASNICTHPFLLTITQSVSKANSTFLVVEDQVGKWNSDGNDDERHNRLFLYYSTGSQMQHLWNSWVRAGLWSLMW